MWPRICPPTWSREVSEPVFRQQPDWRAILPSNRAASSSKPFRRWILLLTGTGLLCAVVLALTYGPGAAIMTEMLSQRYLREMRGDAEREKAKAERQRAAAQAASIIDDEFGISLNIWGTPGSGRFMVAWDDQQVMVEYYVGWPKQRADITQRPSPEESPLFAGFLDERERILAFVIEDGDSVRASYMACMYFESHERFYSLILTIPFMGPEDRQKAGEVLEKVLDAIEPKLGGFYFHELE